MKYILISLGVIILIIFGVVIFNRGPSTVRTPEKKKITLIDYSDNSNATVSFTVDGPINAIEDHRSIKISISLTLRQVTVFTGYEGQVLSSQSYANDINSYGDFLAALTRAGFVKERHIDSDVSPRSICATGSRSFYKIVDNGEDVMDLWTASCTKGSYGGSVPQTNSLFRAQIPNYNQAVSGTSISTGGGSTGLVL